MPDTVPSHKSLLERALSVVTEVRAGEGVSALLLAANGFYLLAFYQVLKVVREALILSESGAVAASYASAGMAAVLLVFVPLYSAFSARVNRVKLVSGVTLFFASHLSPFLPTRITGFSHRPGFLHLDRRLQHGGGRPVSGPSPTTSTQRTRPAPLSRSSASAPHSVQRWVRHLRPYCSVASVLMSSC
jgi:hypothetical protein